MRKSLSLIAAPLLSTLLLTLGGGMFSTFVTISLSLQQAPLHLIGIIVSAYSLGMVLGSFYNAKFILRVGHIRAYANFTAIFSACVLLQALLPWPYLWILLRLIAGYCMAGLFIVIESWLLSAGNPNNKGQFMAFYMIAFYGAQAWGQLLLNIGDFLTLVPFCIATLCSVVSIVPVAITKNPAPHISEPEVFSLRKLYAISPTGVWGCFFSGLILGALTGLLPIFVESISNTVFAVSLLMFVTTFGGMILQYPLGRFSDYNDRRKVLLFLSLAVTILSIFLFFLSTNIPQWLLLSLLFIFGGACFTIYPISLSHACDSLNTIDTVPATQGLLLAYGIGSILSPLLVTNIMNALGPRGLFFSLGILSTSFATIVVRRIKSHDKTLQEPQQQGIAFAPPTPVAAESIIENEN